MKKRAFLVPVAAAVAGLLGSEVAASAAAIEPADTPDSGAALPGDIAQSTADPTSPHSFTVASPGGRLDAFVLSRGPGEFVFVDHQSHASHHSHHSHKSHSSHTSGT